MNSFRLKSYITFLSRNKLFTAINLFGFAVSLMVVVLLGLYIKGALSVDSFHQNKDRIYRLQQDDGTTFSAPIAADIKNRYPEIEAVTRMGSDKLTVKHGDEKMLVNALYVDSTFFRIFSFPLAEGNPARQLQTMNEVVLTKSYATKLFGSEPALGKSISYDTLQLTVCGVVEDFKHTHFANPDMLIRFEHVGSWYLNGYEGSNWAIYLLTTPGSNLQAKLPDMLNYFKSYYWVYQDGGSKEVVLLPLKDCYFSNNHDGDIPLVTNSRTLIRVLELSMLLILLFAVINYINLSVAQSGFRAREAATRRLLGSSRAGLFAGFIWESVLFCAGAFVVAVLFAMIVEPSFNKLMQSEVNVGDALTSGNLLLMSVAIVLLGFISGLIPALAISSHTPIEVVRGSLTRKTKMVYSRIFIVFQYCITIILLGCALTIMWQTSFMRTTDLGFKKANIIYMKNTLNTTSQRSGFRDKLMQIKGVESVSYTMGTPMDAGNNNTVGYDGRKPISFQIFTIDSAFMPMLGIEILRRTGIEDKKAVWLNETAVKELNLTDSATTFKMWNQELIAGVVKDFHIRDLSQKIDPTIIRNYSELSPTRVWTILVKISGANQAETFREVKEAYLAYNGGTPFESGFLDESINRWYDNQQRIYTIIGCFALIAIVIAALGMLAMATYYMRQRTKEIAIRKVFGSTSGEVFWRVILSFMRMVAVAFVLAIPIVWYAMDKWLATYAYRIPLSWTIFAIAGAVAFAIAFVAVAYQSYKATSANPVDSLHR